MNNESFDLANTKRLEDQYIMTTYARQPVLFVRGHGSTLVASDGKSYLDFISGIGVNVLGYDHPRIRRVMSEQASLMHTSNLYYHPYQGLLAEQLVNASGLTTSPQSCAQTTRVTVIWPLAGSTATSIAIAM